MNHRTKHIQRDTIPPNKHVERRQAYLADKQRQVESTLTDLIDPEGAHHRKMEIYRRFYGNKSGSFVDGAYIKDLQVDTMKLQGHLYRGLIIDDKVQYRGAATGRVSSKSPHYSSGAGYDSTRLIHGTQVSEVIRTPAA